MFFGVVFLGGTLGSLETCSKFTGDAKFETV